MTDVLTILEINCATGEETIRPLTLDELAQRELDAAEAEARRLTDEAEATRLAGLKTSAKSKLVAGQPLTEEEASVLVL
jgi:hypothetical protein